MLQQYIDITDSIPSILTYGEVTRVTLSMPANGWMVLFVMRKMTDEEMLANLYSQTLQQCESFTHRLESTHRSKPFHERLEPKRPSDSLFDLMQLLETTKASAKLRTGSDAFGDDDIEAGDTQVWLLQCAYYRLPPPNTRFVLRSPSNVPCLCCEYSIL